MAWTSNTKDGWCVVTDKVSKPFKSKEAAMAKMDEINGVEAPISSPVAVVPSHWKPLTKARKSGKTNNPKKSKK